MPRLLLVQGHVNIESITEDGLCGGLNKAATVAKLRGSTGSRGEREWVGDLAGRLRDQLNARGVETRAVDAIFHRDSYIDWKPNLVLALHFHRDMNEDGSPRGRAMGAIPDDGFGFNTGAAQQEGARFLHRWQGGYEAATTIPITPPNVTLNMTQLYNWCYIDADSSAVILEFGNANVDAAILYEPGMARILNYTRDCILEHFNIVSRPLPPELGGPALVPARRTGAQIAADLRKLADEIEKGG